MNKHHLLITIVSFLFFFMQDSFAQTSNCYDVKHTSFGTIPRDETTNLILSTYSECEAPPGNLSVFYGHQLFNHWNGGCYVVSYYPTDGGGICLESAEDICQAINDQNYNPANFLDCDGDGYSNYDECFPEAPNNASCDTLLSTDPTDPTDPNDFPSEEYEIISNGDTLLLPCYPPTVLICPHNDLLYDASVSVDDDCGSFHLVNPWDPSLGINSFYDKLESRGNKLLPNTTYTISFKVMSDCTDGSPGFQLLLQDLEAGSTNNLLTEYVSVPNDSEWHEVSYGFKTPSEASTGDEVDMKYIITSREYTFQDSCLDYQVECASVFIDDIFLGEGHSFIELPESKESVENEILNIDEYSNFELNGCPFFPIGIFSDNGRNSFDLYKNYGFNTVMWTTGSTIEFDEADPSSTMYKAVQAGLHFNIELNAYAYCGFEGNGNPSYTNLIDLMAFIKNNEEYNKKLLFYFHDNEIFRDQRAFFESILQQVKDDPSNLVLQLNGNTGLAALYDEYVDMSASYMSKYTESYLESDRLNIYDNLNGFAQLTVSPDLHIRPLFYSSLAYGAKGIGYFRDNLVSEEGDEDAITGPIEDVNGILQLDNIKAEIDQMMHIIRMPHWTTWQVKASSENIAIISSETVAIGTREYKLNGIRKAYVFLANNSDGNINEFTLDFSDLNFLNGTEVLDFHTGALIGTISDNLLEFDLEKNEGLLLEVQAPILYAEDLDCEVDPCYGLDFNDGESGYGIWNKGGVDGKRKYDPLFSNSGSYSFLIRDNSSTSVITTDNMDLTGVTELTVDFNFIATGFDDSIHDFWLQLSTDGGSTFTTIQDWDYEVDFENEDRVFESVVINGPFTEQTQLRFRCDASGNNDKVYIDDIKIINCLNYNDCLEDEDEDGVCDELDCAPFNPEVYPGAPCDDANDCTVNDFYFVGVDGNCTCVGESPTFNFNDGESGWGIWNDGGADAANANNLLYANSGAHSFLIKDNTSTSVITTDNMDLTGASELTVDFNFISSKFNNSNHDFWLQLSTDGGSTFTTIQDWDYEVDFDNLVRVFESVVINGPFTDLTQLRFRCDANGNTNKVYIDDIEILACSTSNAIESNSINFRDAAYHSLEFDLVPNPTFSNTKLVFERAPTTEQIIVQIFDATGAKLYVDDSTQIDQNQIELNLGNFDSGIYLIQVSSENDVHTQKLIKY